MAKQVCRDINAKTRTAEDDYFKSKLMDLSRNPTKFWRELALLLGKSGQNKPSIVLNDPDTGNELRGESVPPYINEFFTNIGSKLINSIHPQIF